MAKENKLTWRISLVVILFLIHPTIINAANYITVATIGNRPPVMDKSEGYSAMVERVIEFWQNELKQVLSDNPDLIVLPEACDRPGGLSAKEQFEYFEAREKKVWNFFASVAKKNQCYLVFGTKWQEKNGTWRNSNILLNRQGNVTGIYNKNFPTIGEINNGIVPGTEAPVFKCDFGTIACAICYDLNFTELCDKYASQKPDILVFSSMYHGGLMQNYWAYQCRSFFIAATGFRVIPSEIRNPLGEIIASNTNYFDFVVAKINLDQKMVHLDNNWGKLKKLKEKYGNKVIITDPGKLGPVLITSEHENVSAKEMVEEFDMELLDDYFERSRQYRLSNMK